MTQPSPAFTDRCVNMLRFFSVDAVQKANSGHHSWPSASGYQYVDVGTSGGTAGEDPRLPDERRRSP